MSTELVVRSHLDGVTTLRMNNPRRLNGWTRPMMEAVSAAFDAAAADDATRAVVLTGADPYYCAGVNLSAAIGLQHPRKLHAFIRENNQAWFETFINFPKPLLAAVNGPAIGAAVTSASLCDGIIASDRATFATPFAKLGIPPEGGSSLLFPKLMGDAAERMLGEEGWQPTAAEAKAAGLVQWVAPHAALMDEAQRIAAGWAAEREGRQYRAGVTADELRATNAEESVALATAFLSPPFLMAQYRFLRSKKKWQPAAMFLGLRASHPLWSRMM